MTMVFISCQYYLDFTHTYGFFQYLTKAYGTLFMLFIFSGSKIVYRLITFLQHFQSTKTSVLYWNSSHIYLCKNIYFQEPLLLCANDLKAERKSTKIIPLTMTLKQHVALLPYSSGSEMAIFSYTGCDVQLQMWYRVCVTSYSRVLQFQSRGRKVCVR